MTLFWFLWVLALAGLLTAPVLGRACMAGVSPSLRLAFIASTGRGRPVGHTPELTMHLAPPGGFSSAVAAAGGYRCFRTRQVVSAVGIDRLRLLISDALAQLRLE